jgi:hypothetical protein
VGGFQSFKMGDDAFFGVGRGDQDRLDFPLSGRFEFPSDRPRPFDVVFFSFIMGMGEGDVRKGRFYKFLWGALAVVDVFRSR